MAVLRHLAGGPTRPADLERAINADPAYEGAISHAVLFGVLARLAGRGLVTSQQVPGKTPLDRQAHYALTGKGNTILRRISILGLAADPGEWWRLVTHYQPVIPGVDPAVPNVARMYDYFLGGKDNFAADRRAAEQLKLIIPASEETCRVNRNFLGAVVTYLARAGIRQFLDIGTGLPTQGSVHEVAQRIAPDARVVYVDNDPAVVVHANALLRSGPNVAAIQHDLRDPGAILGDPRVLGLIDFREPVAVLLVAVLHFIRDAERPDDLLRVLKGALAPGSALVVSHITQDHVPGEDSERAQQVYASASAPVVPRTRAQITRFFDGLQLMESGVVNVSRWQPGAGAAAEEGTPSMMYGGVAIKSGNQA